MEILCVIWFCLPQSIMGWMNEWYVCCCLWFYGVILRTIHGFSSFDLPRQSFGSGLCHLSSVSIRLIWYSPVVVVAVVVVVVVMIGGCSWCVGCGGDGSWSLEEEEDWLDDCPNSHSLRQIGQVCRDEFNHVDTHCKWKAWPHFPQTTGHSSPGYLTPRVHAHTNTHTQKTQNKT